MFSKTFVATCSLTMMSGAAHAATIQYGCTGVVTAAGDLSAAVAAANSSPTVSHDCIELESNEAPLGTLDITDAGVTIRGRGNAITTANLTSDHPLFQVFGVDLNIENATLQGYEATTGEDHRAVVVDSGSAVMLTDVTMTGFRTEDAGVLYNEGKLTVVSSELEGNYSEVYGGAIYHVGPTLMVIESSIHDNHARFGGGGIALDGESATVEATMVRSSIHDNVAGGTGTGGNAANAWTLRYGVGGGVYSHHATLTATNCTFTENVAEDDSVGSGTGGNLYLLDNFVVTAPSTFRQVTVADGLASVGESVYSNHDNVTFTGSIISSDSQPCELVQDLDGTHNLLSDTSCSFLAGQQVYDDPQLDPQEGFPAYRPIQQGTPAADLFPKTEVECEKEDQRGVLRPQGGDCDAGAFEVE